MKVPKALQTLGNIVWKTFLIIGTFGGVLSFLAYFHSIPQSVQVGNFLLTFIQYWAASVILIVVGGCIWIGYQIGRWRTGKNVSKGEGQPNYTIPGTSALFPQLDPVVTTKRWVVTQLPNITIIDWYDLKSITKDDGQRVVSGGCKAQGSGVVEPLRYRFKVVIINQLNDIGGESWVKEEE